MPVEKENFKIKVKIKLVTKLDWKLVVIIKVLQRVYVDSISWKAVIYDWIKSFKEVREQLEGNPREERLSTSKNQENIKFVQNLIEQDRRITTEEVANQVGISHGSAFFDSYWGFWLEQDYSSLSLKSVELKPTDS